MKRYSLDKIVSGLNEDKMANGSKLKIPLLKNILIMIILR